MQWKRSWSAPRADKSICISVISTKPQIPPRSCSEQHSERFGLALIDSEHILAEWQNDMQFYMVFSETTPLLLKHSASFTSCTLQVCFLFWVREAPVVCFKSPAPDNTKSSPLKSKVITCQPAFQVLLFQLSWLIWLFPVQKNCNFKVTAL